MTQFSKRLKSLRKNSGYTQYELADMLCISRTTVTNWENGTRIPNSAMAAKITSVFNISADYLFGTSSFKKPKTENILDISRFNELGIKQINDYCDYLASDPKYTLK